MLSDIRMAKIPQKKTGKEAIETEPDAWDRFKDAVHKIVPPKKAKAKPKGKSHA